MKPLSIILSSSIALLFACATSTPQIKEEKITIAKTDSIVPKSIVFGTFCGECMDNCATMYQYTDYKNLLLADFHDNYFKRNENEMRYDSLINDTTKVKLAKEILSKFPSSQSEGTYGCPDCSDGCGIYVQYQEGSKIKRFSIDTDTSQIKNSEVKNFAVYFKNVMCDIKK